MEGGGVEPRISSEINNKLVMLQSSKQNNPAHTKDTSAFSRFLKVPAELINCRNKWSPHVSTVKSIHSLYLL